MQLTKKQNITYSLILIAYAIITLVLVFHHEIWRDEAQVWLVVRDLDLLGVIKHVRTEGHPLLWYFLVMPLAKLIHGFNAVMSMQILNWIFVVAGVGIFLFKSPFNFFLKISLILSSGFLYWYPVIARSYCLIPFLIFLLAVSYKKQKEQPFVYAGLLIALANTHVIMFGFCGALALIFALQFKDEIKTLFNKNNLKNVCNNITLVAPILVFLALLSIVAYLWGSQQENNIVNNTPSFQIFTRLTTGISNNSNLFTNIICYFSLIFGGAIFYLNDKKIFFIFFSNIIFQLIIYCFIWSTVIPQRTYVLFFVLLFCFWLIYEKLNSNVIKNTLSAFLSILFLTSIPNFLSYGCFDYKKDFSQGKKIAKYIIENTNNDTLLVSNNIFATTSISAYLPRNKKFYNMNNQVFYTYSIWNGKFPQEKITVKSKNCPRKIRDKERSDVNEFFEWRLEKVSNCWLRSVGSNYDTRLDILYISAIAKEHFAEPESMEKFEIKHYTKGQLYGTN